MLFTCDIYLSLVTAHSVCQLEHASVTYLAPSRLPLVPFPCDSSPTLYLHVSLMFPSHVTAHTVRQPEHTSVISHLRYRPERHRGGDRSLGARVPQQPADQLQQHHFHPGGLAGKVQGFRWVEGQGTRVQVLLPVERAAPHPTSVRWRYWWWRWCWPCATSSSSCCPSCKRRRSRHGGSQSSCRRCGGCGGCRFFWGPPDFPLHVIPNSSCPRSICILNPEP